MYIKVRVTPSARRERVERIGDRYEIAVKEEAKGGPDCERRSGRRTARTRELVAAQFGVATAAVRLLSGHRSSNKLFSIANEE